MKIIQKKIEKLDDNIKTPITDNYHINKILAFDYNIPVSIEPYIYQCSWYENIKKYLVYKIKYKDRNMSIPYDKINLLKKLYNNKKIHDIQFRIG
ncbi:MAG: hypothetical protein NZZ41_07905, partial [Candidatus Dojkabacteria bacterium]|nr:hypothetical protein [Candidatus Dojkabacteria bacterium]